MRDFKKLRVWENGIKLTVMVYELVKQLPNNEKYGLISQMTRCSSSIPINIAEGGSRTSSREYKRFLEISLGSSFELETFLVIIQKLDLVKDSDIDELNFINSNQQKMLSGLIKKLS